MTLFEIYDLIGYITNKDYDGNEITPDRFASLIKVANIEYFRKKYGLPEQYQPGRPVPLEHAEITLKSIDDLRMFKVGPATTVVTGGMFAYPADYAHKDEIRYDFVKSINGSNVTLPRPVEILRESQLSDRLGNWTKRPTTQNPVGVLRSDGIYIYPTTITSVEFSYYRFPVDPVFAYNLHDGYISYDAGSSTELEWSREEHGQITALVLSYIGINLRSQEVYQYSELKKKEGV